jgi:methylase of polypeptide subunit release factors
MEATDRLLHEGRAVLRPGGWLALEVDCSRATIVARRADALGWEDVTVGLDLFGRERYLLARRGRDGDLG